MKNNYYNIIIYKIAILICTAEHKVDSEQFFELSYM